MRIFQLLSAFLLLILSACSNNAPGRESSTACQGGVACHDGQEKGGEGMGRGGMGMGGGGMGM